MSACGVFNIASMKTPASSSTIPSADILVSGIGLSLVVIYVADLAQSKQFYEVLGLVFEEEQHGKGPWHLACDMSGIVFEIYPCSATMPATNAVRLGFRVTSVDEAIECLKGAGIEPIGNRLEYSPWVFVGLWFAIPMATRSK